jgi:cytochrome P450
MTETSRRQGESVSAAQSTAWRPPPRVPLTPIDRTLFRRNPLKFVERAATFGDVTTFNIGLRNVYLLSHPDHVKDVLVTEHRRFAKRPGLDSILGTGLIPSDGEYHRKQRRLLQPAFHHNRIAGYGRVMVEFTHRMQSRWRSGEERDIYNDMMDVTLSIVAKALFDVDFEDEDAKEFRTSIDTVVDLYSRVGGQLVTMPDNAEEAERSHQALARIDRIIYDMIADRRRNPKGRTDLLSMLLLLQDDETHGGMTDAQLRDEALTLVTAGHETTANALTWTWYRLAQNPEVETKMHRELQAVLGHRRPTVDDLPSLTYTRNVMAESMRLHPPVPSLHIRVTLDHYEVGGYDIPAGSWVILAPHVIHRDSRWWPRPLEFEPDRWTPKAEAERPKFAYFPFGGGPRLCIGEPFAWMEVVLLLSTIGQRWRMALAPGQRVVPQVSIRQRPRNGLRMILERRP